jgi:hypothetical protein
MLRCGKELAAQQTQDFNPGEIRLAANRIREIQQEQFRVAEEFSGIDCWTQLLQLRNRAERLIRPFCPISDKLFRCTMRLRGDRTKFRR